MRQVMPQVSIITTSYNQISTLRLLLASLQRQTTDCIFEVVIADDGSSDGTADFFSSFVQSKDVSNFSIQFVTQPDLGYRKSKILNQAIRKAQSDYLIFLDADIILEEHFIADHLALRKSGCVVCGRRVDLGPQYSTQIQVEDVLKGEFDHLSWRLILSGLKKDSFYVKRGARVPFPWLRRILKYNRPIDLLGSNFGVWKADLLAINGFNEALESYWGEDGDLFVRLKNSGKTVIGAKGMCIQFHVFHPRRIPTPANVELYEKLLQDKNYKWASRGYHEAI